MLTIRSFKVDGQKSEILINHLNPRFSYSVDSDKNGTRIVTSVISLNGWSISTPEQRFIEYSGQVLSPFTTYTVDLHVIDNHHEKASASASFTTGRMDIPWQAGWITDERIAKVKGKSPNPVVFRKIFETVETIKKAVVTATALGIYELNLNGERVGNDYFSPGFTSYYNQIQYQTYDLTKQIKQRNELYATVCPGWAVGRFNYTSKSQIRADRQALLLELFIEYEDGSKQTVVTDSSWEVTQDGPLEFADWYDGEIFNLNKKLEDAEWVPANITKPRKQPRILSQYGPPVRRQETLKPIKSFVAKSGEIIYDFGQNFSGVIHAQIQSSGNETITFRHAEVLYKDELFVKSLRTAKATATYTTIEGKQEYSPRFTYMGFRYVGVSGISSDDLVLSAYVLHSNLERTGSFECSNELLNRLQNNIVWGGKSNFVDIPTDCPQRDERQGWTGDISLFAPSACFNFDMSRFLNKWLMDMNSEQSRGGGIPMVVPKNGDMWPTMATAAWGDSCILVPWAEYMSNGDLVLLKRQYPVMKKFLKAAKWWAGLFSVTKTQKRIWRLPFHFGDWTAPDCNVKEWLKRGKWIATAYWANSCRIVAEIANILGYPDDAKKYLKLREEIKAAYRNVFTDGQGKLKKEFQTAYVLPLHFDMVEQEEYRKMAANLVKLLKTGGYHINTGFTGTPFILFALSDSGHVEDAYKLLLQEECPSWLYQVVSGGTTIWERWDALRPDGTVNVGDLQGDGEEESSGGMVSFNHYANGAVGDWLYRRIGGLEPIEAGYRKFKVEPVLGGGITFAKTSHVTEFGKIETDWKISGKVFEINVSVPVSTNCVLTLPSGEKHLLESGRHHHQEFIDSINERG